MTILSSNNSSITIRASSSNATGNGWVRATLSNGIILQEDFIVGGGPVPQSSLISIESNHSYLTGGTFNYLWIRYNGLTISNDYYNWKWEWKVPAGYSRDAYSGDPNILFLPSNPSTSQTSIYIEVRARNNCGEYSNWHEQQFEVRRGDSSGWWPSTSGLRF